MEIESNIKCDCRLCDNFQLVEMKKECNEISEYASVSFYYRCLHVGKSLLLSDLVNGTCCCSNFKNKTNLSAQENE
jgi:hypothetical protein